MQWTLYDHMVVLAVLVVYMLLVANSLTLVSDVSLIQGILLDPHFFTFIIWFLKFVI